MMFSAVVCFAGVSPVEEILKSRYAESLAAQDSERREALRRSHQIAHDNGCVDEVFLARLVVFGKRWFGRHLFDLPKAAQLFGNGAIRCEETARRRWWRL